jgi:hypothetical protein
LRDGHRFLRRVSVRKITTEKVQKWRCKDCQKYFTFRKKDKRQQFTEVFIKEVVKDFIQGRSSYAVIKERKDVSVGTLSKWINDFGKSCMSPIEIAHTLGFTVANRWSGTLLLDGKYLNKKMVLLVACDYLTLDIVAHLVVEAETEENYIKLVNLIEKCGYRIQAVVSDGNPAILALTQPKKPRWRKGTRRYPRPGIPPAPQPAARLEGIPHQWCTVHAERDLARKLTKLPERQRLHLRKLIQSVLFARTLAGAERQIKKLSEAARKFPKLHKETTLWIDEKWEMLTLHHTLRIKGRKIPRSTNAIENTISYLTARLKTLRRLRNTSSARAITNLIVVNYRTKPLVNTKNKLKRNKSPLILVAGKKRKFDWMEFIKKPVA